MMISFARVKAVKQKIFAEESYSHTAAAGLIYAGLGSISYQRGDLSAAAAYLVEGLQRTDSELADIAPIHAVP